MKLLNFHDFCALPDEAVYQEFQPMVIGELRIRGKVYRDAANDPIDFICHNMLAGPSCDHEKLEFPWGSCRWGLFEYDTQFLVYAPHELKKMAGWLLDPSRFTRGESDDVVSEIEVSP